jgi:hypothetical protein
MTGDVGGQPRNLVVNPSFEPEGEGPWETAPAWHRSPNLDFAEYRLDGATRRSGGFSQRISSRHLDLAYVYQRVPVTGGRTYHVSAWVKVSGDASAMVMAIPGDAEARGVGASRGESRQVPGESDWQEIDLTIPTPEACVLLTLLCRVKTIGENGGSAWFDDVSVTELPPGTERPAAAPATAAVTGPANAGPRPVLVPQPKRVEWLSGGFQLSPETLLVVEGGLEGSHASSVRELNEELQDRFGFTLPVRAAEECAARGEEPGAALVLGTASPSCQGPASPALANPEGYSLVVGQKVQLTASTAKGVFWGVQTLKSLLTAEEWEVWLPGVAIEDWPDHAFRGLHFYPTTCSGAFHVELIEKVVAKYRFNHLVLESQYSNWESHPELHDPRMASKDDLRKVIAAARAHHLEVTPLIQSLGHMDWMFKSDRHLDLVEDPEARWAYNPLHPGSYDFILSVMEEALDLFRPRYFHIGHDEVRYEGRFPYTTEGCRLGFPELFLRDTLRLYEYLTGHGVQVMLWGDEIQRPDMVPHLGRLPQDLIIVDWNYILYRDYPNVRDLLARGFPVIGATWFEPEHIASFARSAHQSGAWGMLQTTWTREHKGTSLLTDEFPQFAAWVTAGDCFWNAARERPARGYDPGARLLSDLSGRR